MTSTVAKLNKYMGKDLPENFVMHVIMRSLLREFDTFYVHYNSTILDNWNLDQMMVQCIQEEERLKNQLVTLLVLHNTRPRRRISSLNRTSRSIEPLEFHQAGRLRGLKTMER
jgi:hypothetical protein